MAAAARRRGGTRAPAARAALPLLLAALLLAASPRGGGGSSVFNRLISGGDVGAYGAVGPTGRSGAVAVATDDSRVLLFGGKGDNYNGDYLNDMWLFDWYTGNWTAYVPNELVCSACPTCASPLANQVQGHSYIRLDDGSYAACDTPGDTSWLALSVVSRRNGAQCAYQAPCFEWTGIRPYSEPALDVGSGLVTRAAPSGRVHHAAALALNRDTGARDTLVMFGGYSTDCTDYCNDTWHYNVPNNLWVKPTVTTSPARRWKHAMADYADVVYLFGGHGMARPPPADGVHIANEIYDTSDVYDPTKPLYFGDLWSYNVSRATRAAAAWTQLTPRCLTCNASGVESDGTPALDVTGPRPRHSASLVSYGGALYLFGGYAFGGPSAFATLYPSYPRNLSSYPSLTGKYYLNDVWRYAIANNTWEKLTPATSAVPSPRAGHSAALSLRGGAAVMFVFGGTTWDDEVGDLWQFNLSSRAWALVTGEGTFPSRRTGAVLVPVGQSSTASPGSGPQAGRLLLALGHGCLKGSSYAAAAASTVVHGIAALGGYTGWDPALSASGNGTISVFGSYVNATTGETVYSATPPDLWVEALPEAGERYCVEELDDTWEYSPAACPGDCSRRGSCEFNSCVCDAGFWGADCSLVTCPGAACAFDYVGRTLTCSQCGARGSCDGLTGACTCVFPASGPACDQAACLNGCSGHGVCDTASPDPETGYGTCTCDSVDGVAAYSGADCSVAVCPFNPSGGALRGEAAPCSGRGTCVLGVCVCYPGFGDSFYYRAVSVPGENVARRIPITANGTAIPGCGYEGTPGCEPEYVADCGGLLFVPAAAPGLRPPAAAAWAAAAAAWWLLLHGAEHSL